VPAHAACEQNTQAIQGGAIAPAPAWTNPYRLRSYLVSVVKELDVEEPTPEAMVPVRQQESRGMTPCRADLPFAISHDCSLRWSLFQARWR
jgi:hypothetical protein